MQVQWMWHKQVAPSHVTMQAQALWARIFPDNDSGANLTT